MHPLISLAIRFRFSLPFLMLLAFLRAPSSSASLFEVNGPETAFASSNLLRLIASFSKSSESQHIVFYALRVYHSIQCSLFHPIEFYLLDFQLKFEGRPAL